MEWKPGDIHAVCVPGSHAGNPQNSTWKPQGRGSPRAAESRPARPQEHQRANRGRVSTTNTLRRADSRDGHTEDPSGPWSPWDIQKHLQPRNETVMKTSKFKTVSAAFSGYSGVARELKLAGRRPLCLKTLTM